MMSKILNAVDSESSKDSEGKMQRPEMAGDRAEIEAAATDFFVPSESKSQFTEASVKSIIRPNVEIAK